MSAARQQPRWRRAVQRLVGRLGVRGPLVSFLALIVAGAVLVIHGEPRPVQRYSGVSVPVETASSMPAAVVLSPLLVISDGALTRVVEGVAAPVPEASGAPVISLRQVSADASAALLQRPDGVHAVLLPSTGEAIDLGLADFVVPGAAPAVVALQRGGVAYRFDLAGAAVDQPVPLPAGLQLAADSTLGIVASSAVGPIARVGNGGAQPTAEEIIAGTRTALERDGLWIPMGAYQPLAANGVTALLWNPLLHQLGLLDLRRLAIVPPVPAEQLWAATEIGPDIDSDGGGDPDDAGSSGSATPGAASEPPIIRTLLPVTYPSVQGIDITGPAAFSTDGQWISIAGQVGARPRMLVGLVPSTIVRGQTELSALSVISLGGELAAGQQQPVPVWSAGQLVCARLDGTVVVFSTATRQALGQQLTPALPDPTPPDSTLPDSTSTGSASSSSTSTRPAPTSSADDLTPDSDQSDAASSDITPSEEESVDSRLPIIGGLGVG